MRLFVDWLLRFFFFKNLIYIIAIEIPFDNRIKSKKT